MVEVLPFRGLRFADDIPLSQVTAPPYDAIDDALAEDLRGRHPHNVVRLERGLGTGRREGSVAGPDPYERVADTYRRWNDLGDVARRLAVAGLDVQPVASGGSPSDDRPEDRALGELRRADGPAFILAHAGCGRGGAGVAGRRRRRLAVRTVGVAGRSGRADRGPGRRPGPRRVDRGPGRRRGRSGGRIDSEAREAASRVRDGSAGAAFLVRPVTVEQVRRVAETGLRMPPKSTSFHPKPRTGLVIRPLRP